MSVYHCCQSDKLTLLTLTIAGQSRPRVAVAREMPDLVVVMAAGETRRTVALEPTVHHVEHARAVLHYNTQQVALQTTAQCTEYCDVRRLVAISVKQQPRRALDVFTFIFDDELC